MVVGDIYFLASLELTEATSSRPAGEYLSDTWSSFKGSFNQVRMTQELSLLINSED